MLINLDNDIERRNKCKDHIWIVPVHNIYPRNAYSCLEIMHTILMK